MGVWKVLVRYGDLDRVVLVCVRFGGLYRIVVDVCVRFVNVRVVWRV